jgi:hypothetical protein
MVPEEKFTWARTAVSSMGSVHVVEKCYEKYTENGYAQPMYAPGRMIHLKRVETVKKTKSCFGFGSRIIEQKCQQYEAAWISKDDLACGGHLALSVLFPGAVTDHFPWYMIDAFDEILRSHR